MADFKARWARAREPVLERGVRETAAPVLEEKTSRKEKPRGKLRVPANQAAPGNQSDYLSKCNVAGARACADEVQHLTGRHSEVLREVARKISRRAVCCHNSGAADGRPDAARKVMSDTDLIGLCAKWRRELCSVRLSRSDLRNDAATEPRGPVVLATVS
jgi:hypothetical protein